MHTIVFTVACVIILIGCACTYVTYNDYSLDASLDDGKATVTVDGLLPSEYRYTLCSGANVPDKIYLYKDDRYVDFYPQWVQDVFLSSVCTLLERRGFTQYEYVNAERLFGLMSDYDAVIVFASGSLPSNVFDADVSSTFETWLRNGGTVYWNGPAMGTQRSAAEGCATIAGPGFFAEGQILVSDEDNNGFSTSEWSDVIRFTYSRCDNGFKVDGSPGTRSLGLTDENGYSSFAVTSLGSGSVYITGGTFIIQSEVESRIGYVETMICGIDSDTIIKERGSGHKGYGTTTFSTSQVVSSGDVLYVSLGPYSSGFGRVTVL